MAKPELLILITANGLNTLGFYRELSFGRVNELVYGVICTTGGWKGPGNMAGQKSFVWAITLRVQQVAHAVDDKFH
jgi:hypothetical protein